MISSVNPGAPAPATDPYEVEDEFNVDGHLPVVLPENWKWGDPVPAGPPGWLLFWSGLQPIEYVRPDCCFFSNPD